MKSLLCEMPLNILSLAGPATSLSRKDVEIMMQDSQTKNSCPLALPAYDNFTETIYKDPHIPHLSKVSLCRVVLWIRQRIPHYIRELPTYDVLLIERTDRETYFRDVSTVISRDRPSGASLRRIENHQELSEAISHFCNSTQQLTRPVTYANISLERCSLFYQCHLFSHALVVIGQHGAALSNIAFMVDAENDVDISKNNDGKQSKESVSKKRTRHVIEINPPPSYNSSKEHFKRVARQHFRNLSRFAAVDYQCIAQEHDVAPVDIEKVVDALKKCLE